MRHILPTLLLLAALLSGSAAAASENDVFLPMLSQPLSPVASYLGGPAADGVVGAGFDPAGQLLLAGNWPYSSIGGRAVSDLAGAGPGALVRLAPDGRSVLAAARLGGEAEDMEVAGQRALVCGDFGLAVVAADLSGLIWQADPGAVSRCALGADGSAAALVGGTVHTYGPGGAAGPSWAVAGSAVADIALDSAGGRVFATGYTQKASNLKVAYLRAYSLSGGLAWTAYDFSAAAVGGASLGADSEGRLVSMGADGRLYFAGWTDGGNAIYSRDPQEIGRRLGADELISFDAYNTPFNLSGARSLAWYGRFDPSDGQLELGQWLLTRLSDGKGNSIGVRAIAAAADGTLVLTGDSYASMAGRSGMAYLGTTLGSYSGGETYLLVVSPDFRRRLIWTALAAPGTSAGGSPGLAAAISDQAIAIGATLNQPASGARRGLLTTAGAPQPALSTGREPEAYFLLVSR